MSEIPTGFHEESGLFACGHAVLVRIFDADMYKGLIEIPETVKRGMHTSETRGIVMSVGEDAWVEERKPRAVVGDKIILGTYAGSVMVGVRDGKTYRMVNDRDIYCRYYEKGESP